MASLQERITSHLEQHPDSTAREIADALGLSRQRIYQGLKRMGIRTTRPAKIRTSDEAITGGVRSISTRTSGTVGELLATVDLIARGYQVYRPVVDHRSYDLIAVSPDHVLTTVEVRMASRGKYNELRFSRIQPRQKADVFAVIVHGEQVQYVPDSKIGTFAIGGSRFAAWKVATK